MNDFNQLAALCHGKHIYIQTHNFPDPDAIASAFGLQRLLAQHEIPSTLCYDGRIDKLSASKMLEAFQIQMFPYEQLRPDMAEEDYVICVDAQRSTVGISRILLGMRWPASTTTPFLCQLNTATRTSAPLGPAPRSSPSIINSFRACRTGTRRLPCSMA